MQLTQEEYIERIARRTAENTQTIRESLVQRRNAPVDLYGMEYTRQGGPGVPATFYISISPDMVYLERYEFKLIIAPFTGGGEGTNVSTPVISPTSLTISGSQIVPNPHTHEATPHTHSIAPGITSIPSTASDFRIIAEGIDITPYLAAQHNAWIAGDGIYPDVSIHKYYDMLKVASVMCAEGNKEQADLLTKSGYKKIQITASSLFSVTLVLYCKYSHLNR